MREALTIHLHSMQEDGDEMPVPTTEATYVEVEILAPELTAPRP